MKPIKMQADCASPFDTYLDSLIRLALLDIEKEETERLMEGGLESLSPEEQTESDRFYERTKNRLMPQIERKLRRMNHKKISISKVIEIAACMVLVIGISAPFAIANIEAIRVKVMKLLIEIQEDHTDLSLVEDESASFVVPKEWRGEFFPSYIPEGFEVVKLFSHVDVIDFEDASGDFIEFDEFTEDSATGLDTEDAVLSYATVNGVTSLVVEKNGKTTVTWSEGNHYFIVISSLAKQEVLRIADSVVYLDK